MYTSMYPIHPGTLLDVIIQKFTPLQKSFHLSEEFNQGNRFCLQNLFLSHLYKRNMKYVVVRDVPIKTWWGQCTGLFYREVKLELSPKLKGLKDSTHVELESVSEAFQWGQRHGSEIWLTVMGKHYRVISRFSIAQKKGGTNSPCFIVIWRLDFSPEFKLFQHWKKFVPMSLTKVTAPLFLYIRCSRNDL